MNYARAESIVAYCSGVRGFVKDEGRAGRENACLGGEIVLDGESRVEKG